MSQRYTLKAAAMWHDSVGNEVEAEVRVTYTAHRGHAGTMIDPPEPASVEIVSIVPVDPTVTLPAGYAAGDFDETFFEDCLEDYAAEMACAAEWRAEARRDALMEGF
ncbi:MULTISPECIES: hypothetical protein [unclassified Novosphingobium]|uniref:hypothetical protein n=1 Tax=unclassified Novosphingobium TaxID=2644732 RepID=UPI00135B9431|nr:MULTISPECIES: hypothetical protein [unclassified Novosphingobium]